MCFSAEASFTAAVALAGVTYLNFKTIVSRSQIPLALVPAFFGAQQFSEGLVWLAIGNNYQPKELLISAQYLYLFFAFVFWPLWIPFSLYLVESVNWRKMLIGACFIGGIIFGIACAKFALTEEVTTKVYQYSIHYVSNIPTLTPFYAPIVLLPCFLSSYRNMWLFGILTTVSFAAAMYMYEQTFTSVWCFFSAIMSISLYKVLRDNSESILPMSKAESTIEK